MAEATIDRSLTDQERSLLLSLATRNIADNWNASGKQPPCTDLQAVDVMARLLAEGKVEIISDEHHAYVLVAGNVRVETTREWLSFHAAHPGNGPMKDEVRN